VIVVLSVPHAARADGDPASDYLIADDVYVPIAAPSGPAAASLRAAAAAVYASRQRVKVAVIAGKADLGAVPSLFDQPATYARFLGQELRAYYIGPLVVVMPAGFGVYDGGRSTAAEQAVLEHLPRGGSSATELTATAADAVRRLLRSHALRSKDVLAPTAAPVATGGRRGQPMRLRYNVSDDSGRSSVDLRVLVGAALVAGLHVPLRAVKARSTYTLVWHVPRVLPPGHPRLCVTARDPAGNRSRPYCTPIQIS
jgi:hypothetical protein